MNDNELYLCYVQEPWAYFTIKMEGQWGDDWDGRPYECNAGEPYDYACKVAYEGDFITPDEGYYNSPFSVDDINRGDIAWLRVAWWSTKPKVALFAGATLAEFKEKVETAGGTIYEPTRRQS